MYCISHMMCMFQHAAPVQKHAVVPHWTLTIHKEKWQQQLYCSIKCYTHSMLQWVNVYVNLAGPVQ